MDLTGKFRQLVEQQPFDQFQTTRDRDAAKWISQHGGAAIALVGDSIAFGISSQLNQGVEADAAKGLTSTAVLSRIKANVKLKNATTAVISVGSNDIVGGKGNAAMLTANAQKIRNELNAKQYIWIVPYDSVAADAIDKAKGAGDQLIALKDFSTNDGVHPGSYTAVANAIRTITKKSAPATAPTAAADTGKEPTAAATGASAQPQGQTQPEDLETLQKALIAAGFDLPKYGADGKMGPETKQAILRAEQKLGRSPTGSITTQELAKLKGAPAATAATAAKPMDPAQLSKLTQSVANIEQALSKIKKESVQQDPVSEMAQWRNIVEVDLYVPPNTGGSARDAGRQARMQMARNPNPAIASSNDPFGLAAGKAAPAAPAASKTGKLAQFGTNLAKRTFSGGAAKVAAKMGLRAVPYVGWALLAKDMYDAWQDVEEDDVDAESRAVIEREMPTIMSMADNAETMGTVPKELQDRIKKIVQQLETP
jgi:peptidoglycan hydrolase-like protein with peptidoglycan-binding domain